MATIQDVGGPAPGLFQANQDAMEAFVAWCNSVGGVNGRALRLLTLDSAFFDYRLRVEEACEQALALVGSMAVLDDAGVEPAIACGIPEVPATSTSVAHARAANVFDAYPNPADQYQVGQARYYVEHHPDAVRRAALFYSDHPLTHTQALKHVAAYEQVGFEFVHVAPVGVIETSWGPHVEELREKDVGYVFVSSEFTNMARLQKELQAQGVTVEVMDANSEKYTSGYLEQAGSAAEGTYLYVSTWPFEEAGAQPEMARFLDWYGRTNPGSTPTALGALGWSAGLLFATVVDSLGSEVTREGLLAALGEVHEWTGGGIHGPSDPAGRRLGPCFVELQVRGGEFVRVHPDEGFDCSPGNVAEVEVP
ncbi:MAG: ABC transporter substrate-binding protein [Acidimicrobiia bacterium]|nr:ABC transporter substrate-binding protein [Acidimicrobiia bacterium]